MNLFLLIVALLMALTSAVGAFNRRLPGPALTFVAILVAKWAGCPVTEDTLWFTLVVTVLTVASGYFLPVLIGQYIGRTKAGFRGAAVTTIAVILFSSLSVLSPSLSAIVLTIVSDKLTFALILCAVALLGALEGEMRTEFRHPARVMRNTFGSTLAYITGSGAKILYASYVILYLILDILICLN